MIGLSLGFLQNRSSGIILRQATDLEVNPSSQPRRNRCIANAITTRTWLDSPGPPRSTQNALLDGQPESGRYRCCLLYQNSCWNLVPDVMTLRCGGTLRGGVHGEWLGSNCWHEEIIWSWKGVEQAVIKSKPGPVTLLFHLFLPWNLSRPLASFTGAPTMWCCRHEVLMELHRHQRRALRLPEPWSRWNSFLVRHPASGVLSQ